jgi:hypothetical protein
MSGWQRPFVDNHERTPSRQPPPFGAEFFNAKLGLGPFLPAEGLAAGVLQVSGFVEFFDSTHLPMS